MKKLLITLPCFDEDQVLEKNTKVILEYAQKELRDYDWSILIIDNASSDKTFEIATSLSKNNPKILVNRYIGKGRGAALKNIWLKHKGYDVYAYMDIDLATDLDSFAMLVQNIDKGYHISVGSRYVPGARAERSMKRRLMSQVYNILLRVFLKVDFKDAQCGFKAFDVAVIDKILPETYDSGWFWDTEFMILAARKGFKTIELPVAWRETRDEIRKSKVSPFTEVMRQLKNIKNMHTRLKKIRMNG